MYIVSNSKTKNEPRKVVVRMYGGNHIGEQRDSLKPLTVQEELVLVCELGRRNLAPKLYGFWNEGRIEEFIDSHQMSEEESNTPDIETDLAKNLARFHAVDNVPLAKPTYDFGTVLRNHYRGAASEIAKILANDQLFSIHSIMKHDWEKEIDWLEPLIDIKRHRMVLMHWDTHLQNIGVRNSTNGHKPIDGNNNDNELLKTFLYDYEFSCYNMRGKDIGLFLVSKVGLIGTNDLKLPTAPAVFPELKDCKHFFTEYMKECRVLFDDWDESVKDSLDHIIMESILGVMVSCICYIFVAVNTHETFVQLNSQWFEGILNRMNDCFHSCKKKLQESYPDYEKTL